jgi:IS1 family transposase
MAFHDAAVQNVKAQRVQVDEIWTFTYAKEKNVKTAKAAPDGAGDTWTWTAIDADTKLLVSFFVADRSWEAGRIFIHDVRNRLANRVRLTSDSHRAYLIAVQEAFGEDVDYALDKIYRKPSGPEGRYSPAVCIGAKKRVKIGDPDPEKISTSYVERTNLTMRMHMRRFTLLTNAFSKKLENHVHMVALYTAWYNYVKQHKTLDGASPAMATGLSQTLWSMTDLAEMVEASLPKPGPRGPYKPRPLEAV